MEITKLCKLARSIKAKVHKTKGPKMRDCLLKTMGETISMMNLHLFFLPEVYTGVLFHKFVEGGSTFCPTWTISWVVPAGIIPVCVDISLGVMGKMCLWVASLETVANGKVSEPLAVGLGGNPVSCVEWQDVSSCLSAQWCPSWYDSASWGPWTWGALCGMMLRLSLYYPERPQP